MSKYHLSSIRLVLIVVITSSILYFGFDWELGYGIIWLIGLVDLRFIATLRLLERKNRSANEERLISYEVHRSF